MQLCIRSHALTGIARGYSHNAILLQLRGLMARWLLAIFRTRHFSMGLAASRLLCEVRIA